MSLSVSVVGLSQFPRHSFSITCCIFALIIIIMIIIIN